MLRDREELQIALYTLELERLEALAGDKALPRFVRRFGAFGIPLTRHTISEAGRTLRLLALPVGMVDVEELRRLRQHSRAWELAAMATN